MTLFEEGGFFGDIKGDVQFGTRLNHPQTDFVVLANFVDQSLILLHLQIKRFLGVFSLQRRE